MQSMTKTAILKALTNLRESDQMANLQDAARCRSESDWLIGINGTRAFTTRIYGGRGGNVASVGRVQTPTLTMVYERELQIRKFKSRAYWQIFGTFGVSQGDYEGAYQKPDFSKSDDEHDRADRIWDKESVAHILEKIKAGARADVSETKKRARASAPRLYDLTTLQREANGRYGLSATRTLQLAQALYEKHKMITYPRTDSKALPEDYVQPTKEILGKLQGALGTHAQTVLKNGWVKPNKRIYNNAQISDHFAIIPTGEDKKLSEWEAKIYDMIACRFVAIFFPASEHDVTIRLSVIDDCTFKTQGKVLVIPGWLTVYGKDKNGSASGELIPITEADGAPPTAELREIESLEDATQPPPRYTEATLLSAMENAGKLVEDEELAEAMKEKGLGTPATRAQIIDHLVNQRYMTREQRQLAPTLKAETIIEFLKLVHVEDLTSPTMTGEWEHKMHMIEDGKLSRKAFMKGIAEMTTKIVTRTTSFEEKPEDAPLSKLISPTDKKPMREFFRSYNSQDGEIVVYKTMGNRKMTQDELQTLLNDRKIGPLDDFTSKRGKTYSATLTLNEENKVKFVFDNNGEGGDLSGNEPIDFAELQVVGKCPVDGQNIREANQFYACEHFMDGSKRCKFRVFRTLLSKTVAPDQMKKLLDARKTDLIEGFISKRTRRPFKAFLTLDDKGKIGFEFPPREAKKKKAKTTTKKAAVKSADKK